MISRACSLKTGVRTGIAGNDKRFEALFDGRCGLSHPRRSSAFTSGRRRTGGNLRIQLSGVGFMQSLVNLISTDLSATVAKDRHIRDCISRIVPASHAAHVQFCRLDEHCLHLTLDSAAWITRLRFMERQLIDTLREERILVDSVRWHVAATDVDPRANAAMAQAAVSIGGTPRLRAEPVSARTPRQDSVNDAAAHSVDDRPDEALTRRLRESMARVTTRLSGKA